MLSGSWRLPCVCFCPALVSMFVACFHYCSGLTVGCELNAWRSRDPKHQPSVCFLSPPCRFFVFCVLSSLTPVATDPIPSSRRDSHVYDSNQQRTTLEEELTISSCRTAKDAVTCLLCTPQAQHLFFFVNETKMLIWWPYTSLPSELKALCV